MAYKRVKKLNNRLDKWKKADMLDVGTFAAQVVAHRTFDQRRTISGRTLNQTRAYSKKTIYIPTVGVMPKARGGELTKPRKGKGGMCPERYSARTSEISVRRIYKFK